MRTAVGFLAFIIAAPFLWLASVVSPAQDPWQGEDFEGRG